MSTLPFVALLRSVNVGGRNLVPMAALATLFREQGLEAVSTYIQSGNVLFRAPATGAGAGGRAALAARLEAGVLDRFGVRSPVVLRTRDELAAVVAANPFPEADPKRLAVTFLAATPDPAAVLDPDRSPPDRFVLRGRELYLWVPSGLGETKLTLDWFERRLGTTGTTRNWNTVNVLVDRLGAIGAG